MRDATRARQTGDRVDRPIPVDGAAVQGNVRAARSDPDSLFSGFMPVPMRYGMTLGELARLANDALAVGTDLVVVPALGWTRTMYTTKPVSMGETSPNMPDIESALLYPAPACSRDECVGRSRDRFGRFGCLGAPWLDAGAGIARLEHGGAARCRLRADDVHASRAASGKVCAVLL